MLLPLNGMGTTPRVSPYSGIRAQTFSMRLNLLNLAGFAVQLARGVYANHSYHEIANLTPNRFKAHRLKSVNKHGVLLGIRSLQSGALA